MHELTRDFMLRPDHPSPTVLLILDGFGCGDIQDDPFNAIAHAKMPVWDELCRTYPNTQLDCSGQSVGLPDGQMGNSEVGHIHMGSGRLMAQELTRINQEIANRHFFSNPVLCGAVDQAVRNKKALHILGLLSPGGVHCHEAHMQALAELAVSRGLTDLYIHAFLDGRDTPPKCAADSIRSMEAKLETIGHGRIASLIGRFYAMDRDNRWDRTEQSYRLIVEGAAEYQAETAIKGLENAYARGETDEFVGATRIMPPGMSPATIDDGDVAIFMNFRTDRVRQLVQALTSPDFKEFEIGRSPALGALVTLTEYHKDFDVPVAYPQETIVNGLGEVFAKLHLTQLRLAETEKYAHVTFFFNGGREKPFEDESRILVPSPKVKTYDLQPEMNASIVTSKLVEAIESRSFDVIICNYANCDMVGHTGDFDATVKAVEAIDHALGEIVEAIRKTGGELLITADHGNAEQMIDPIYNQAQTAHTVNPVPLVYVGRNKRLASGGSLIDVAPTMLDIMGIEKPVEMTGRSLIL